VSTGSSEPVETSWCVNVIRRMREARWRNLNLLSSTQKRPKPAFFIQSFWCG
jgi:hypothetical protein